MKEEKVEAVLEVLFAEARRFAKAKEGCKEDYTRVRLGEHNHR